MKNGRTISIPTLCFNYADNRLESIETCGEMYIRVHSVENERLRKLVRDMHKALFSLNLDHCQACPREDACVFMHRPFDCGECAFERDMRELGIEVDG